MNRTTTSPQPDTQANVAASATDILRRSGERTAEYLRQVAGRYPGGPRRLIEAIEYSLLAGGKRLRPTLALECAAACGKSDSAALAAAGAVELVHTFSLVHDDLPAMDDDDLRRGRPTNHKVYGEAMAILAGDAMVTMAFEILAVDAPGKAAQLIRELAAATGPIGMIGGQVLDMDGQGQSLSLEGLQHIHRLKTGALLTASCRMGAVAAGATPDQLAAVTDYGRHLGLAFQIVDDILDVTSTPEQLGKATGKDAGRGKNTYPGLLGLAASKAEAQKQLHLAIASLHPLGALSRPLQILAEFVVQRDV